MKKIIRNWPYVKTIENEYKLYNIIADMFWNMSRYKLFKTAEIALFFKHMLIFAIV